MEFAITHCIFRPLITAWLSVSLFISDAFFLSVQAVDILRLDYDPSDLDILYSEGVISSNGLACVDFSFPQSASDDYTDSMDQHDSLLRSVPSC